MMVKLSYTVFTDHLSKIFLNRQFLPTKGKYKNPKILEESKVFAYNGYVWPSTLWGVT